ncbi:MAG: glycosyl transferase family 51, partial [Bryobacteraceae bacterium]
MIGGSTLATQLEKLRHSPGGRTNSVGDKFWQMASASLRAYQYGPETMEAQRKIVRDYINSIPFAAAPGFGEVTGLGDGLAIWYGADFDEVNGLLAADEASLSPGQQFRRARAYREVLSLLLALRQPSRYLLQRPQDLSEQTDRYLRALCDHEIISTRLKDLALAASPDLRPRAPHAPPADFVANKGANAIRVALLSKLGLSSMYDLDGLDLTAQTTLDANAQRAVTDFLQQVQDAGGARKAGLQGYHLLESGNPQRVIYSFVMFEHASGANLLRVEADNYDAPLNINSGTRLELGSTAKLRTLINYLQIVAALRAEYGDKTPAQLASVAIFPGDNLTAWALQYLSGAQDRSLPAMLQAALDRKYSASPWQGFFTAGGLHYFQNFEPSDNGRIVT